MNETPANRPRLALVTGGTEGIGAAISEALLAAGYRVAANYASQHAVADAFSTRTGIPVYSWNVADLEACRQGVARVEAAARAGRDPGEQRRHHARRDAPQDDARRNGAR